MKSAIASFDDVDVEPWRGVTVVAIFSFNLCLIISSNVPVNIGVCEI